MKGESMRDEHPKIVGLSDLRNYGNADGYDPWSVAIKIEGEDNWLWRALYWASGRLSLARAVIELRREVHKLRHTRLAGLRESDQAGALGLQLYAENEALKDQVEELTARLKPKEYKDSIKFHKDQRREAETQCEVWRRKFETLEKVHNRLIADYEVCLEKFFKDEANAG